ncbi:MAG: heparan-alpha-glucosaminide N-acetyltransferase domain-containing protein [Ignavibacteriales bacterium]|nr:heparan-alpha-glucosaminide N-acetyltransferase domain-containing protein [Ignavibacteriales bacterium]
MKNRLVFVDLLRGWATIIMIEVHVFNAFLLADIKNAAWFGWVNFVNGLVAPSFLFVAGFVFVVASDRKLEEFRTFGKAYWRQLSRIVLIWVIGYGLHLPYFSLTRTVRDSTAAQILLFSQSDILHCIAIGLLIVFLGRIVIRRDLNYQWFLAMLGSLMVLLAPFIWEIDCSLYLPGFIAPYFNDHQGSIFPLFPWLGFLMFGALAAFAYKKASAGGEVRNYFLILAALGSFLVIAGTLLVGLPAYIPHMSTAIRANPIFFASRLGIVCLLLVGCWYYSEWRKTEKSFVLDASKESLLVYTAHLLVIYGRFWDGNSPAFNYGESFTVFQAIIATIALIVVMIVFARAWSAIKQKSMRWARIISYATGLILLAVFIVRVY